MAWDKWLAALSRGGRMMGTEKETKRFNEVKMSTTADWGVNEPLGTVLGSPRRKERMKDDGTDKETGYKSIRRRPVFAKL